MLDTIFRNGAGASEKLDRTSRALDELAQKTDGMMHKVEKFSGTAETFEAQAIRLAELEERVAALTVERQTGAELSKQASDAQTTLLALRQEGERHAQLQAQWRASSTELDNSVRGLAALKGNFETLRSSEAELRQQMNAIAEAARQAKQDCASASGAVQEVSTKFEALEQLRELSQDTEKRLASLNALAEHVAHKTKTLETQKHTVEHAVLEATRLNEMVWTMDAQVAKLAEGRTRLEEAAQTVAQMEQLAKATAQELVVATAARDEFVRESARLEGQGRTLADQLRSSVEQLAVDKKEFEAFDQRLKSLSAALGQTESRVQDALAKDATLVAMQQKSDALAKSFTALRTDAEELARKQSGLDALADRLAQVDDLGKRTAAQYESLTKSQQDLDAVRGELAEFHKAHAQAAQLRDKLALDRTGLEAFAERAAAMLSRAPELETRMDAVLGKLALIDEGNRAAQRLAETSNELDAQLTRVAARQQFVETLDERVNGLHVVTVDVERKLAEQLARRAEVESLKQQCDTLGTQVADAQQKLDGVAALQTRLLPVTTQVTTLMQTLEESQRLVATVRQDKATVQAQQARFAELAEQCKQQAAATAERLKQVQSVSEDLARAATLKESLLAELAGVQAKQRDALAQVEVAQDHLQRAETMTRQLEQRRAQLQHTEKAIGDFEARLLELDRNAEVVDQKIKSLAEREDLVQAVKDEVDNIRQLSSRSRADLQFVTEHRSDVSDLRAKLEELGSRALDTDAKISNIETRRKAVEEVQSRATAITHMLGDINMNLEMLSEQRAVIDDVGEKLARLDFTVQEAQNTLRALQREREVAERIEQGIKALRARGGSTAVS